MNLKSLEILYNFFKGDFPADCLRKSGKPLFPPRDRTGTFLESLPEQEGVRSDGLLKMFEELSESSEIRPHSALVLRNGRLISKADWTPFSSEYPHVSHSLAKSITALAVGIAISEKRLTLSTTLSEIFRDYAYNKRIGKVTIRQLLTMSSGVKFSEAGSLSEDNWVKAFLSSELLSEPGKEFRYNSMNTYMLSACLCSLTNMSLSKYISERLFAPMGIVDFFWETCPKGIEKGGWGLYLSIYDYAKIGQLWLDGGTWNGTQLVSKEWIRECSAHHISHKELCRDGYGYQVWIAPKGLGTIFSGMFGQLVYICPAEKTVIALTAGSSGLFPCGKAVAIISNFLSDPRNFSSKPVVHFRYAESALLRNTLSSAHFGEALEFRRESLPAKLRKIFSVKDMSIPEAADALDGAVLTFRENRAGICPMLIQIMHGCLGNGIVKIAFFRSEDRLFMRIFGGENLTFPLNFNKETDSFEYSRGGPFRVCPDASFTSDEDGYPVLKVNLCFVETSCTRVMKFIFREDGVILKLRESPELYSAADDLTALTSDGVKRTLNSLLENDIADYKIKSFIEPTLFGKYGFLPKTAPH